MIGKPRADAPNSLAGPMRLPRLRQATRSPVRRREGEWLCLSLIGMIVLAIGGTSVKLTLTRVSAIDATLSAMAAGHLLSSALNAAVRLQVLADQAGIRP
jgi:hypothetical protein